MREEQQIHQQVNVEVKKVWDKKCILITTTTIIKKFGMEECISDTMKEENMYGRKAVYCSSCTCTM